MLSTLLEYALKLGTAFVVVRPQFSQDCILPRFLLEKPEVVLSYDYRFQLPSFTYDDEGIQATLSFSGVHTATFVPWSAVVAILTEDKAPLVRVIHPTEGGDRALILSERLLDKLVATAKPHTKPMKAKRGSSSSSRQKDTSDLKLVWVNPGLPVASDKPAPTLTLIQGGAIEPDEFEPDEFEPDDIE